jgi:hypothetical protein
MNLCDLEWEIGDRLPAGMIETPVKWPSALVRETMEDLNVGDSRSLSLHHTTESVSGKQIATNMRDPKKEASETENR